MQSDLEISLRVAGSPEPAKDERKPAAYQRRTSSVPVASRIDPSQAEKSVLCGSPHCSGCYEIELGVRIHPPECGEGWKEWLLKWEPKGRIQ